VVFFTTCCRAGRSSKDVFWSDDLPLLLKINVFFTLTLNPLCLVFSASRPFPFTKWKETRWIKTISIRVNNGLIVVNIRKKKPLFRIKVALNEVMTIF
jgi:hypothetical protein